MFSKREKWDDIDWCDQNIHAASLSDSDLVEAATRVHPYSTALIDLLGEADRRKLDAIAPIAKTHLRHPDPFVATSAVGVLQSLGDISNLPLLVDLVPHAIDHYHLAEILDAIVVLDHSRADFALETAESHCDDEYFDNDYVVASVMVRLSEVLPDDSPALEQRLLDWAMDERLVPTQRETIYRRLAAMPRTQPIEDFFVQFCLQDDGAYPNLMKIVDHALRKKA